MTKIWDNQQLLGELEKKRESLRAEGKRLTFDCLNLKCVDDRAYCSKGHHLGLAKDGSLFLLAVLRGIAPTACSKCKSFVTEE